MVGITNASIIKPYKRIYNFDNLLVWFDGTDFINHAPTGDHVTAINKNDYNQLSSLTRNEITIPTYYKAAANANGIDITVDFPFNFKDITMCAWSYRISDNNYNNIFTIGNTSASFIELRCKEATASTGAIKVLTTTSQGWAWSNNNWCFLAATIKDNVGIAYADAARVATIRAANTLTTYANFRILGTTCWTSDTGGPNHVTDCRIYDYALSAEEIVELYKRGPLWHV